MKIICTENEEEWLKELMIKSDNCGLRCPCELFCKQCIEKNVRFEREAEE